MEVWETTDTASGLKMDPSLMKRGDKMKRRATHDCTERESFHADVF